jgi:hypothetical protein
MVVAHGVVGECRIRRGLIVNGRLGYGDSPPLEPAGTSSVKVQTTLD